MIKRLIQYSFNIGPHRVQSKARNSHQDSERETHLDACLQVQIGGREAAEALQPRVSCQPTPRLFLSPITALFLSSFSFLCIWCKTKPFIFPIPSLPVLLSLPLFSTYSLNQDVVGTDMYINSLTTTRNQVMHLEAFSSFLSLFVYLPLGPTSYLS